jgi:DNA-binding HxlR family transcriptional regulator
MKTRMYAQECALASALDVIGDRWALLVLRELLLGPKRFTDLSAGLPGSGTNTLSARLEALEADGVIARKILPPPAATTVYALTPRGDALRPVLLGLVRWGAPAIGKVPIEHPIRANWIAIAMLAFFRPGPPPLSATFVLPTGSFAATVAGDLRIVDGEAPGTTVRGDERALLGALRSSPDLALDYGILDVEGDRDAVERLLRACRIGR